MQRAAATVPHPLEATKSMDARANLVYPIPAPDGSEIWPKRQWLWSKDRAYELWSKVNLKFIKVMMALGK